jgi:hypothetical protein
MSNFDDSRRSFLKVAAMTAATSSVSAPNLGLADEKPALVNFSHG